jgi:peroxiredoxin
MPIKVGDKIPDVGVHVLGSDGMPETVQTGDVLSRGKTVLFAVPGAFTPGCSELHIPDYVKGAGKLAGKGVTTIACVAMNDAWVMDAWAKDRGAEGKITMLADGNGAFTEAMGLGLDGSGYGLGPRSMRYAAIIEDGTVTHLAVEPDGAGVSISSCANILDQL